MTILITSGGTIIKIDDVRNISNFSSGSFLSKIAEESLLSGHRVIYLHAKNAKKPFQERFIFDPAKTAQPQFSKFLTSQQIFSKIKKNIIYVQYQTFDEYASALEHILSAHRIDIAFMGAAVSDYGMDPHKGKLSSSKDSLVLKLKKNKKVIQHVKRWSKYPLFQVGFKLLSGVDKETLVETAYKSGLDNKSDITIGNDLQKIRSGKREVFCVTPERGVLHIKGNRIPKEVLEFAIRRARTNHFRTITTLDKNFIKQYRKEFIEFKSLCARLYKKNLMSAFYKGSSSAHGSLMLKVDKGFLITARGSNKKQLTENDIVLVTNIDWKKRIIYSRSPSGKKASLNAPLAQKIFDKFPRVRSIVHTHSFKPSSPTTSFPETPGTLEYVLASMPLFKKGSIINLNNHGLIAIGDNLKEIVQHVIKTSKK